MCIHFRKVRPQQALGSHITPKWCSPNQLKCLGMHEFNDLKIKPRGLEIVRSKKQAERRSGRLVLSAPYLVRCLSPDSGLEKGKKMTDWQFKCVGVPETIILDREAAVKSQLFSKLCEDIPKEKFPGKDMLTVERLFSQLDKVLLAELAAPVPPGEDHPAGKEGL